MINNVKKWLKINHPHSEFKSFEYISEKKLKIVATYLDMTNSRHGHGDSEIITENFYIDVVDIYD